MSVSDFRAYSVHGDLEIVRQPSQSGTCEVESLECHQEWSVIRADHLCKETNRSDRNECGRGSLRSFILSSSYRNIRFN